MEKNIQKVLKVLLILLIISIVLNLVLFISILKLRKYAHQEHQEPQVKKDIDTTPEQLTKKALQIVENQENPKIDTFEYYQEIDEKPKPISIPKAPYPREPSGTGSPRIVVKVLVDTNGSVIDAKILKAFGDELCEESALEAARKAKFIPAKHNGKPVHAWIAMPIDFTLK